MKLRQIFVALVCTIAMSSVYAESQFSGPYLGLQIGYANGDDQGFEFDHGVQNDFSQDTSPEGEFFGLTAGFNYVFNNNVLLGIEVDYNYIDADYSSFQKELGVLNTSWPVSTKVEQSASIKGRLGHVLNNDQTLLYVLGGYSIARIQRKITDLIPTVDSDSNREWNKGWLTGLGLEHFVTSNLSARIEYRHAEYSTESFNPNFVGPHTTESYDYDEETIQLGISYHF
ncbi:MAG: porin family protein [Pseudomonadales bacterium]|nr:porin family protein [Pseudomonadales bacterium]NRA14539.1 porin family protein [Oceanospirillaceae bacterium]